MRSSEDGETCFATGSVFALLGLILDQPSGVAASGAGVKMVINSL